MNNLKDKLFELSDEKYKKFHSGLCPNTDNIIGTIMLINELTDVFPKILINKRYPIVFKFKE